MRSHSYLNTCKKILAAYDGSIPFAAWVKDFFRNEKKYGGSDRKQIGHACYSFFRLGHAFRHLEMEERILIALFLCSTEPVFILKELRPGWNEQIHLSPEEKMDWLGASEETGKIFPFTIALSEQVRNTRFQFSFLKQPDLFLRIRPGKKESVINKLNLASIPFIEEEKDCIRLANQSKIEEVVKLDEEAVVQDLNSQRTLDDINLSGKGLTAWDCCAASGGKSILLHDHYPGIQLTVSDVRESILHNLRNRFNRAGIGNYQSFVADLAAGARLPGKKFDLVICDAPCSGSGTWARTPEQLSFFREEQVSHYVVLQKGITSTAVQSVKPGGLFVYITCSVFEAENEKRVEELINVPGLELIRSKYLEGYNRKADSLFTAVFRKH